jgi:hypothetical protein
MQECASTGKSSLKRVTVRSGGAGHAHSGVAKTNRGGDHNVAVTKPTKLKIVRLGR